MKNYWTSIPTEEAKKGGNLSTNSSKLFDSGKKRGGRNSGTNASTLGSRFHPILLQFSEDEKDENWKEIFSAMARGRYSNVLCKGNDIILKKKVPKIFKLSDSAEELKEFLIANKVFRDVTLETEIRETDYLWEEYNNLAKKELLLAYCRRKSPDDVYSLYNKISTLIIEKKIKSEDIVIRNGQIKRIYINDSVGKTAKEVPDYDVSPLQFPIKYKNNRNY